MSLLNWAAQTSSNPAPQGVSQDASLEGIRGPLTMILAWHDTLERNWRAQDDTQCKRWFSQILQEAATKGKADATKDEFYPVTTHSLSALVIHPKPSIRAAAVGLFPTLARLSPLQSLRLLPLVVRIVFVYLFYFDCLILNLLFSALPAEQGKRRCGEALDSARTSWIGHRPFFSWPGAQGHPDHRRDQESHSPVHPASLSTLGGPRANFLPLAGLHPACPQGTGDWRSPLQRDCPLSRSNHLVGVQ